MAKHHFKGSKDPANAITLAVDALLKLLIVIRFGKYHFTVIMIVVVQKNKIENASSGNFYHYYRFT